MYSPVIAVFAFTFSRAFIWHLYLSMWIVADFWWENWGFLKIWIWQHWSRQSETYHYNVCMQCSQNFFHNIFTVCSWLYETQLSKMSTVRRHYSRKTFKPPQNSITPMRKKCCVLSPPNPYIKKNLFCIKTCWQSTIFTLCSNSS